jgi:hypothetical protein
MGKIKIFSIDDAVEEIRKYHDRNENIPVLVGVQGPSQDSGKTYFCRIAAKKLHQESRFDVYSTKSPDDFFAEKYFDELEYLFFDIGINNFKPGKDEIDFVNDTMMPLTKRDADMNVFVFNPAFSEPNLHYIDKYFDLLVSNPGSVRKNSG